MGQEVMRPLYDEFVNGGRGCGCLGLGRALGSRLKSSVPGLNRQLLSDKDLALCLLSTDYDPNDIAHWRMLRTIYVRLTTSRVCPRAGRHWETFGFRHPDPCTDLNAVGGLLNVVHLFVFLSIHFDVLREICGLALDGQHQFPFAFVSLTVTRIVTEALLAGRLSAAISRGKRGVFETT